MRSLKFLPGINDYIKKINADKLKAEDIMPIIHLQEDVKSTFHHLCWSHLDFEVYVTCTIVL